MREDVLGCNPTASREHIQSNSLSEENMPNFSCNSCDMLDRLERLSFMHMPFDTDKIDRPNYLNQLRWHLQWIDIDGRIGDDINECRWRDSLATYLFKHLCEERFPSKYGSLFPFPKEEGRLLILSNDESTIIKRRGILSHPCCYLGFPARRE